MSYIVAAIKLWNPNLIQSLQEKTGHSFHLIQNSSELTPQTLSQLKPEKIFFPHWSYLIPREIWNSYECIMFHMTDLPFGRGGSPLQNLIVRGFTSTQISAFKCASGLDTGPIYLKKPLSLDGRAQDIFERASVIIEDMIVDIIKLNPIPVKQPELTEVGFQRRLPAQSEIQKDFTLQQLFDHIRMLDADHYPPAFLKFGPFTIEFKDAKLVDNKLTSKVVINYEKK